MFRLRRVPPVVLLLLCAHLLCADGPAPSVFVKTVDNKPVFFHVAQKWTTRTTITIQMPKGKNQVLGYETTFVVHWHADTEEDPRTKKTTVAGLKCSAKGLQIQEIKDGKNQDLAGEAKQAFDALAAHLARAEFKFARAGTGYALTPSGPAEVPAEEKKLRASLLTDPVFGLSLLLAPPLPKSQQNSGQLPLQLLKLPGYGRYEIDAAFRKAAIQAEQVVYEMEPKIIFYPDTAGGSPVGRIADLRLKGKVTQDVNTGLVTRLDLGTQQPASRRVELRSGGENTVYEVTLEYHTQMIAEVVKTK